MATISYKLAPNFIHYFRKANGEPLTTDGYIYSYKDIDHNTPKPIYQDADGQNAYANPLPIDSAGSVKLMYYADDEQYYIELYDGLKGSGGQLLDSFEHFPDEEESPDRTEHGERNFILNPEFLKLNSDKLSFETGDLPDSVDTWIAYEGWTYRRNNTNATNTINFKEFTPGQTNVPDNPKYYLEFECTAVGGGGENTSDILLQLPNVSQFSGETVSFAVYLESSTSSSVELVVKQHFGSGGSADNIQTQVISTTASFNQYKIEDFSVDSVSGKDIRDGNYIAFGLRMPLNAISVIKMTKFQLNRGAELLPYDYKTLSDEGVNKRALTLPDPTDNDWGLPITWNGKDFEINTDEVGRIRADFKDSIPGYVVAGGSTVSTLDKTPDGYATYDRLWTAWENDTSLNGNSFGYGYDGFIAATKYTNNVVYLNSLKQAAITDWADNNTGFTFTLVEASVDRNILGTASGRKQITTTTGYRWTANAEIFFENTANGDVTNATAGTTPFSVSTYAEGTGSSVEETIVIFQAASALAGGEYWTYDTPTNAYYIWYKKDGVGADPAVGGRTGILVEVSGGHTAEYVAELTRLILNGHKATKIETVAASALTGGEYFRFYNSTIDYVGYITIDGVGSDPEVGGTTSIEIPLVNTDGANEVATKLFKYIRKIFFNLPDLRGMVLRMRDGTGAFDPDRDARYLRGDNIGGNFSGTWQRDNFEQHRHEIEYDTGGTSVTRLATTSSLTSGFGNWATTVGGNETRMVNMYINYFIKY